MKNKQIGIYCVMLLGIFIWPAHAGISWQGNVFPRHPFTWNSGTDGYIGKTDDGTLNITDGSKVTDKHGYIGYSSSTGKVTVDGHGSTWTNKGSVFVGSSGVGVLNITNGGTVSNAYGSIGNGEVVVDGVGSVWANSNNLYVGSSGGSAKLNITNGGAVSNGSGYIGGLITEVTSVTVDGSGSKWSNYNLTIGSYGTDMGNSLLTITGGGLVSVTGTLTIWENMDGVKDGFINIASGGMLALNGQADGSLDDFLGLIVGTDAIHYWNDSISDWADITTATDNEDYTLTYIAEGDLNGYTILAVPEPATLALFGFGGFLIRRKK